MTSFDISPPRTRSPSNWHAWATAVALLGTATALGFLLGDHVSLTSQAMVYVLAVVIAAYRLDWVTSAVCAVAAVCALNFFFVPPRWTFAVESNEHLIALGAMLVVALVISHLAAGLRRETAVAQLNAHRARQLQALASELAETGSVGDIARLGQQALDAAFDGPCLLAIQASDDDAPLQLPAGTAKSLSDGLRQCMRDAAVLGPGTGRWPGLNAWYLPLVNGGRVSGGACVQDVRAADTSGLEHAQALCTLLAQALWRLRLAESARAAQGEAQRQQLQSTLLAAISHDFRTPLSAVVGAASALQTQRDKLPEPEQERLLAHIVSEATYLTTVTDNTLQLMRLVNSSQPLQRDWESVEEIVGAVLARLRRRDPDKRIQSRLDKDLPLVRADPVLLAQLLENLLDNALKYGGDAILLQAHSDGQWLSISVRDHGPGIPATLRPQLFEPYSRGDQAGAHGLGLGLAVCRAIALAHGGALALDAPEDGPGCRFTLTLPVETPQPLQAEAEQVVP